jgi:tRNA A-37 threonylcarbamoyl transferase component Bud32
MIKIKDFNGFSGNQVSLYKDDHQLFVRKSGKSNSIQRNVQQLLRLSELEIPVPAIISEQPGILDMEYIHGMDIHTYLIRNSIDDLVNFLITGLDKLSARSSPKDYTNVYQEKLKIIKFDGDVTFTKQQLYDRLPKILPATEYHGDLTLENIIYTDDRGFYLIDAVSTEYDSYVFDIAKLRQDLELGWFERNEKYKTSIKTKYIQQRLLEQYPISADDSLLIMMLLRVYPYTKIDTLEREIIVKGMNNLWK